MSLWLEILKLVAVGDLAEAERMLNFELPLLLRTPEVRSEGGWHYRGPVARRVRIYFAGLPDGERGMAASRSEDFVDYIADLILANVRRTIKLLEYCLRHPEQSIDEIGEQFTGWDGMKRSLTDRQSWVKKQLASMAAADIPIPSKVAGEIKSFVSPDDQLYGYHELALINQWKIDLSWRDFKEQEEIDRSYLCVEDSETDEDGSVADEAIDYGAVNAAQVVLHLSAQATSDVDVDLNQLGKQLTADLIELLESFNTKKPSDGYRPIAWHNVWWNILSRYVGIPFKLNERDPFCSVDRELADYIDKNYPDVIKPNRLNIFRRRTRLEEKCVEHAQSTLIAWANSDSVDQESN